MGRILIVEDSSSIQSSYAEALGSRHILTLAASCQDAYARGTSEDFDLIIMDLGLPDGDGFDLCRRLAGALGQRMPPFVFVSGRFNLQDKLSGFALGAEDYIVKPFEPQELLARIEIRLKRHNMMDKLLELAKPYGLRIDTQILRAYLEENGKVRDLNLTPNEFRLLCVLLHHSGHTLSRAELLKLGWGSGIHVLERTIDRHISALRRKLGPAQSWLEAVPGHGYRWTGQPTDSFNPA